MEFYFPTSAFLKKFTRTPGWFVYTQVILKADESFWGKE